MQHGIQILNSTQRAWPRGYKIAVMNNNDFPTPPLKFDGEEYDFPIGESVEIDPEVAFFLFAVESRHPDGLKITRDKNYGKNHNNDVSYYDECLLRYGCAHTQQGRKWFANFDFAIVQTGKRLSKKTFEDLKKSQALPATA